MDLNPAISPIPDLVNKPVNSSHAPRNLTRKHPATLRPANRYPANLHRRGPHSVARTADPEISPAKTAAMIVAMTAAGTIAGMTEADAAVADAGAEEADATTKLAPVGAICRSRNTLQRHLRRRDPLRRVHTNHHRHRKTCRPISNR